MMYDDTQRPFPSVSDSGGRSPTSSDDVRHSLPASDSGGQDTTVKKIRSESYSLTTAEVVRLWAQEQVSRDQRSVQRYCKAEKLDCFYDDDVACWYVTPESATRLLHRLKELDIQHAQSQGVGPRPSVVDAPAPAPQHETRNTEKTGGETPTGESTSPAEKHQLEAKLAALEDQLFQLTIDNKAREQVITELKKQMKEDRTEFVTQLTTHSYRVGQLEAKLEKYEELPPPRMHILPTPSDTSHVSDAEFTEATPPPAQHPRSNVAPQTHNSSTPS